MTARNLGLGAMIKLLRGNEETISALQYAMGRTIAKVSLDSNVIYVGFADGSHLRIEETAQSCCEERYTRTDDDLASYEGATFVDIAIKDAPPVEDSDYTVHDVQFLELATTAGPLTFSNHNEHNGYYGGFHIEASFTFPEVQP